VSSDSGRRPSYGDRRPSSTDRRSGPPARYGAPRRSDDRDGPGYVKREPERGSRRREEDIGETWPELPGWATPDALDVDVRRDLRGLSKEGADWVAANLVAAGALADDDPETAWRHARAARARGGRIGVVRETVGLVAYRAGEWAEAIGELRAARRMGGGPGHLAVMADCERALGHPERAIELSRSAEADVLDPEASTELSIVVSGARADLGQIDAAMAHLERLGLDKAEEHPRLAYAYADLLLKAGRPDEALSWFIRAANADAEEETDALDRVADLSGGEADGDESDDVEDDEGSDVDLADDLEFSSGTLDLSDTRRATDGVELTAAAEDADEMAGIAGGATVVVEMLNPDRVGDDDGIDELDSAAPDPGVNQAPDGSALVTEVLSRDAVIGDARDGDASDWAEPTDKGDEADGAVDAIDEPGAASAGTIDPIATTAGAEPEPESNDIGIPTVMFSDDPQTGER